MPFLSGATPPKNNPGSAPALFSLLFSLLSVSLSFYPSLLTFLLLAFFPSIIAIFHLSTPFSFFSVTLPIPSHPLLIYFFIPVVKDRRFGSTQ